MQTTGAAKRPEWHLERSSRTEYDPLTDPCLARFWAHKSYCQEHGGTSGSRFVNALVREQRKRAPAQAAIFSGVFNTNGILRPRSSQSSRTLSASGSQSFRSWLDQTEDLDSDSLEMSDLLDVLSQSPTRPASAWFNGPSKATHELAPWPEHYISLCSLANKKGTVDKDQEGEEFVRDVSVALLKGKLTVT